MKSVIAALGALVALGVIAGLAYAGNVPLITGPQDPSQLNATINSVITQGNANWSPAGASFNNANSIKANGTVSVTAIGSLGPTGLTPATVSKWMKVIDNAGNIMVIPMWACPTC